MKTQASTNQSRPENALVKRDNLKAELLRPLPTLNDAIEKAAVSEPIKLQILENARKEILSQVNSFDRLREPQDDPAKNVILRHLSDLNTAMILSYENPEKLLTLSELRRKAVDDIFQLNKELDVQRQERFTNHFSVGVFTTGTAMTVGAVGLVATGLVAPLVVGPFMAGGFFIAGAGVYNLAKPYVEKNIKYILGAKSEKPEENKQPSQSSEKKPE